MTAFSPPLPTVVLISGRGSNLNAILRAVADDGLALDLRAVVSNRPKAQGIARAQAAGVATRVVDHTTFSSRAAFDHALHEVIADYQPALVVLAGYMRVLAQPFVLEYRGRLLNIHPSLLPAFPGLHTHQRALLAGVKQHGASVHFVTPEVDCGPVIVQASVPVLPNDNPGTLGARVLAQEHIIYHQALSWFAAGRLQLNGEGNDEHVLLDGCRVALNPLSHEIRKGI